MPVIDMHAHLSPERYKEAIRTKGEWYGLDAGPGELGHGKFAQSLPERLADMDALGMDMQLITPTIGFYQYANELETTKTSERAGRAMDHETEDAFERLRTHGYM